MAKAAVKTATGAAAARKPRPAAGGDIAPAGAPATTVVLRRKELVERVAAASGARKKDVREIVAATLKVLGEALAADETLALPPFGKARVNRHRDTGSGEMLTVKLRRPEAAKAAGKAAKPAGKAASKAGPKAGSKAQEALAAAEE